MRLTHLSLGKRSIAGSVVLLAWTTFAQSSASAQAAHAGASGRFVLEIKSCPALAPDEVRRILGIEIGDLLVGIHEAAPADSDRLSLRCAGNLAWVEASADKGSRPVDRTLKLDDFPGDAAPRALALAGIEVLAALSPAVRERIQAKQKPAQPVRPATAAQPSREQAPATDATGLRVGVAGVWRRFLVEQGASAWGGQLNLARELARRWQLAMDVEAAGTTRHVSLGDASGLLFSAGAFFGARTAGRHFGAALGLGGRLGVARLAGSAAEAVSATGASGFRPWGGAAASASGFGELGPFMLTAGVEVGRSLLGIEGKADGARALTLDGTWVALSLGAAFR